jgi:hypothetical protein
VRLTNIVKEYDQLIDQYAITPTARRLRRFL